MIAGKVTLDEAYYIDAQCTGTPNADVCMADQNKTGTQQLLCQCSTGFIRHNASCLKGTNCSYYIEFLYDKT